MRLSRIFMALTVGLAVVAAPTAAGAAQPQPQPTPTGSQQPPYVPQPPVLTVNPSTLVVGETATLTGAGFGPNETVDHTVTVTPLTAGLPGQARRSDGGTVEMTTVAYRAAAPSRFTAVTDHEGRHTVTHRPDTPGRYLYTAVGRTSGRSASATLTVLAASQPTQKPTHRPRPPHGLPVTGDDLGTPLAVGGGLLGVGVVLTLAGLAWRRRGSFGFRSPR
ncbi:hypothetical protein [Micromonospora okii]|uniref:hypothetical protein n=1 Tax=Micromonospora okii TaxID=1182970 RepID=UPI001E4FAE8B|nr:hypothetical protein [Micromonospora okii]